MNARNVLVERLHTSPHSGVVAVTGGGVLLLADLLTVPGASATVLDARVPYSADALAQFIGAAPEQACSVATACDIAMAGFLLAHALSTPGDRSSDVPSVEPHCFGFGCTASLTTTSPKRGAHRAHFALQTLRETRTWSITLVKGTRDRLAEERLVADIALQGLAESFDLDEQIDPALLAGESVDTDHATAPTEWGDVLLGRIRAAPVHQAAPPTVLFPGAFNPLHDGHRAMAHHAQHVLGDPVAFEICTNNVDKPRLNYLALRNRIDQFDSSTPLWVTNTATFVEKARRFPGVRFIVGVDTVSRIGQAKYYDDDPQRLAAAVAEIGDLGCRFLVFGRTIDGRFTGLDDCELPAALRSLCNAVAEADFRQDVSSSELRARAQSNVPR